MLHIRHLNLVYLHYPKCAGQEVVSKLTHHYGSACTSYKTHGTYRDIPADVSASSPTVIGSIRNPFKRIASCFTFYIQSARNETKAFEIGAENYFDVDVLRNTFPRFVEIFCCSTPNEEDFFGPEARLFPMDKGLNSLSEFFRNSHGDNVTFGISNQSPSYRITRSDWTPKSLKLVLHKFKKTVETYYPEEIA